VDPFKGFSKFSINSHECASHLDKVIRNTLKIFPKIRFDDIDSIRKIIFFNLYHLFDVLVILRRIDLDTFIETLYFRLKDGFNVNLAHYLDAFLEVNDGDLSIEDNYLLYNIAMAGDAESFSLIIQHPSIYNSDTIFSDFRKCIAVISRRGNLSEEESEQLINLFNKNYDLYHK
jgi:hypothetical protein